jgi:hypothetical protein
VFHFDADPDPTFHSDADPDSTFQFDPDPESTTHYPLGLPPFHFDADLDPDPDFHFDPDPGPAFHFHADPDPQHCFKGKYWTADDLFVYLLGLHLGRNKRWLRLCRILYNYGIKFHRRLYNM